MENKMPKDFFWGNSTSSMQTEGGWNEGGKGPSVYDVNTAGRSAKDWQVTNDNYHHYSQDLDLMKEMNMNMVSKFLGHELFLTAMVNLMRKELPFIIV